MNNRIKWISSVGLAVFNFALMGSPLVESYWPLNDGDQKTFVYDGSLPLTMSVTGEGSNIQGEAQFEISEAYQGSTVSLQLAENADDCYFTGVPGWLHVSFDPQVLLLDDSVLQNGGTVRTSTTAGQTGISYPATFTIRVAKAGAITVPGGTFADCRSITASEVAHVRGETISASALTAYLAPGVGIIKTLLSGGHWAEFVSGTVGGIPVGEGTLSQITVGVSGSGAVTPNYNGHLLAVGHTYTMTAKPKAGNVLDSWSDGNYDTVGTTPKLTFTMQSDLVLQANFIPNPFPVAAGKYIGLFMSNDTNTVDSSGFVSLDVTSKGSFSGYWETGNTRHPLSGQLDVNFNYTNTVTVAKEGPLGIFLNVPGSYMTGTITSQNWTAQLFGNQLVSGRVAFTDTGRYSVVFSPSENSSGPSGNGSARMNFAADGATTLAGTLPDGTKFSASSTFSPLGPGAQWPFYTPLYGGKGCLLGWMDLDGPTDVSGNFTWIRPPGRAYPDGFVIQLGASSN